MDTAKKNPSTALNSVPLAERPIAIALISAIVLILELALIRQVPAEVRIISYFSNLLLMASFFGLGLGCILQEKRSLEALLPLGIVGLFGCITIGRGVVVYPESQGVHFWVRYVEIEGSSLHLPMVPTAVIAFLATALPFAALGQALARTMDRQPRLVAYSWDIAGSLVGTLLFAFASWMRLPPWIWPAILLPVWAVVFLSSKWKRLLWVSAGLLFLFFSQSPLASQWSPYYFIQSEVRDSGTRVWVNSSFHQFALNFANTPPDREELYQTMVEKWSRPYKLFTELNGRVPRKVLILGAGTGNDVAVARSHHIEDIVAVEIDPVILSLGRTDNPTEPYNSPKVRVYIDDARHFLRTTEERFDVIIFATLDSQALLSGQSNLRLENYVYTRESLLDARELLEDGGVLAVYYSVFKPWLYKRIYSTVHAAFGYQSKIFFEDSQFLFNTVILAVKGVDSFRADFATVKQFGNSLPSTDDWPFIYLERPMIAPLYLKLIAIIAILIVGVFLLLRKIHPVRGLHVNFLLLGVGFTLMESSAIVRMALLFGSTWTINPIVISAVLLTIFLANWGVLKHRAPSLALAWPALCAFIFVNYLLPISWLLELSTVWRVLACGALIAAPVYFASICFSRLFRSESITGYALGLNLVGAMCGGFVEYVSMLIGMRQVWMIVLLVYLLAWFSTLLIAKRAAV
jgi:hypothetical protein